jgi:hypothetical protein
LYHEKQMAMKKQPVNKAQAAPAIGKAPAPVQQIRAKTPVVINTPLLVKVPAGPVTTSSLREKLKQLQSMSAAHHSENRGVK